MTFDQCCFCLILCLLVFQLFATACFVSSWNNTNGLFPSLMSLVSKPLLWFTGLQRRELHSIYGNTSHTHGSCYIYKKYFASLCVSENGRISKRHQSRRQRRRESSWAKDWKASSGRLPNLGSCRVHWTGSFLVLQKWQLSNLSWNCHFRAEVSGPMDTTYLVYSFVMWFREPLVLGEPRPLSAARRVHRLPRSVADWQTNLDGQI